MRAEAHLYGRIVPPRAFRDRTSQTFDSAQHPVDIGLVWVDCTSTISCGYEPALLQPTITCDREMEISRFVEVCRLRWYRRQRLEYSQANDAT